MGNALDGILDGMCKIVHRIDTPFISGIVMCHVRHTINNRISHVHIWACHIDSGAQNLFAVGIFARFHLFKQNEVFFYASLCTGIHLTRLGQRTAVFTDLIRGKIRNVSFAFLNQLYSALIHLVEIVGCKEQSVLPVCAQPFYVRLDRFYKFDLFLRRVGIVKTEIEFTAVLLCKSII